LFLKQLKRLDVERRISLSLVLKDSENGVVLSGKDEDGNEGEFELAFDKEEAVKKDAALKTISTQLGKLGNTIFKCCDFEMETAEVYFFPVSVLKKLRRGLVEKMIAVRQTNRVVRAGGVVKNNTAYPESKLGYAGNVLNEKAKQFYERHGVESIERGAESGVDMVGKVVMSTKYCIRRELGLCEGQLDKAADVLFLEDEQGRRFEVRFRCGDCGMEILNLG